jgi:Fe-S-cluster containining protein
MSGDHNMKDSFECPRCGHCCAVDEWDVQDNVNHPKHYTSHPSGVECIEIT